MLIKLSKKQMQRIDELISQEITSLYDEHNKEFLTDIKELEKLQVIINKKG